MATRLIPPEIPLPRWQELHEATMTFRRLEPWTWMYDKQLMCVIDSAGEPWFAAVLGAAKEVFGLCVYHGETGLSLYSETQSEMPLQMMSQELDALTLWFCAKSEMDVHEKKRYAALNYAPAKGTRQAWPKFLSHRPGFVPWHLEPSELDAMLAILRCITPFAAALRDNPELWLGGFSGDCFKHEIPVFDTRNKSPAGHSCEWRAWNAQRLSMSRKPIKPTPETRRAMTQLRQTPVTPDMHIEMAVLDMGVIAEHPRPYLARLLLVADSRRKVILYDHMLQKTENAAMIFLSALMGYINTSRSRPCSVRIADYQMADAIGNVLNELGIKLSLVERLPVIDNMQNMITRRFR